MKQLPHIEIPLLSPAVGKIILKIDYQVDNLESVIRLTNPRVDIPARKIKDYDARNHPNFRAEVLHEQGKTQIQQAIAQQVGPIAAIFRIDWSELLA